MFSHICSGPFTNKFAFVVPHIYVYSGPIIYRVVEIHIERSIRDNRIISANNFASSGNCFNIAFDCIVSSVYPFQIGSLRNPIVENHTGLVLGNHTCSCICPFPNLVSKVCHSCPGPIPCIFFRAVPCINFYFTAPIDIIFKEYSLLALRHGRSYRIFRFLNISAALPGLFHSPSIVGFFVAVVAELGCLYSRCGIEKFAVFTNFTRSRIFRC